MAPFTPFIAEDMYMRLANIAKCESVHLESWPEIENIDAELLEEMVAARKLVETGLSLRASVGIKVRQPLASFTYTKGEKAIRGELQQIIADELNVKSVIEGDETILDNVITPELKSEGQVREFTRGVQEIRKEKGFAVSDLITLTISTDDAMKELIESYKESVMKAISAKTLEFGSLDGGQEIKIDDVVVSVKLEKESI